MPRFWNLQTKFVVVLIVLLLGSLVAQTYVHEQGKTRLRAEVVKLTEDLANEVTLKVPKLFMVTQQPDFVVNVQVQQQQRRPITRSRRLGTPQGQRPWMISPRLVLRFDEKVYQNLLDREITECQTPAPSMSEVLAAADLDEDRWLQELPQQLPQTLPAPMFRLQSGDNNSIRFITSGRQLVGTQGGSSDFSADSVDLSSYTDRVDTILDEDRQKTLLSLLAIFLSGIGTAWFLGSRITRPVHALVEGFQRVADGDLQTRVPERRRGEFGLLGRQFNSMVGRLRDSRQLQRELELRERVQHMGDLAAGVAHDVRNPLNAIYLNIGQIRDEFLPASGDEQQRFLRFTSDIQQEVERLNELVTNFLSLAQPSSGDREVVAPNELVRDLGRLLEKEAASRKVAIATQLDEGLPSMHVNQQELRSAFLNVAMNALQAMEADGGGQLDIVTGQREGKAGPEAAISFIDSGCGIPPEKLEQIFIPYYTTREGGTGLGMAISQRIAERYGGRIEVRSRMGEGTTVSFVFPQNGLGSDQHGSDARGDALSDANDGGDVA